MPVPGDDPALDAETQAPLLLGIAYGMLAPALVAVALRLYTRFAILKAPGADDALITIAAFFSVGFSASVILQTHYGLGRHHWMVSEDHLLKQLKALLPGMELYNAAQIVTKISFSVLYRRIFEQQAVRVAAYYLIVFLSVWGVAQSILVVFGCFPVAVLNPAWKDFCIKTIIVWYLTSIMNIVTDFIVFLLPLVAIRGLQLRIRQRLLIASLFGVGFFTCIISIVRLFFLRQGANGTDATWDNVGVSNWTVIELNSGIICACLPAVRRFFKHASETSTVSALKKKNKKSASRLSEHLDSPMYALRDVEAADSQQALRDVGATDSQQALRDVEAADSQQAPANNNRPGRDWSP